MGLFQIGRSRSWVDDHGWWIINVEFQPSGFSKGSYLNVGVQWLWLRSAGRCFMVGHRVGQFKHFEDETQFGAEAVRLVASATAEVVKHRRKFLEVGGVAEYYLQEARRRGVWPLYRLNQADPKRIAPSARFHGGVALGLVGRADEARTWFDSFVAVDDDRPFVMDEKAEALRLRNLLADQDTYREAITETISAMRVTLQLPTSEVKV